MKLNYSNSLNNTPTIIFFSSSSSSSSHIHHLFSFHFFLFNITSSVTLSFKFWRHMITFFSSLFFNTYSLILFSKYFSNLRSRYFDLPGSIFDAAAAKQIYRNVFHQQNWIKCQLSCCRSFFIFFIKTCHRSSLAFLFVCLSFSSHYAL